MNMIARIGHNGGPAITFNDGLVFDGRQFADAQQAVGFAQPALYRTHAFLEQRYPSFDYAGLVPINTDGDMWDVGTLIYSGDIAGKAEWLGGKVFDIPNVGINFTQGSTAFHLAGTGYELSVQEVNRFSRIAAQSYSSGTGGAGSTSLGDRKSNAANMVAQKFIYDRVIRGDTRKNTFGLVNFPTVPTANAPNGSWATATPAQMLADVNTVLNDVIVNSRETAFPDTLILPTSAFLTANNTQMPNVDKSVLSFIAENNSYTAMTKRPLNIGHSRELETAGASNTRRMVAMEKSPDNMEFFLPGPFEFMPLFQTSSMTWRVDGVMNVGELNIYRPKTVSYRDNI
jgi:hypothetical protein